MIDSNITQSNVSSNKDVYSSSNFDCLVVVLLVSASLFFTIEHKMLIIAKKIEKRLRLPQQAYQSNHHLCDHLTLMPLIRVQAKRK